MHILFDIETVPAQSALDDAVLNKMDEDRIKGRFVKPDIIKKHMDEAQAKFSLQAGTAQIVAIVAHVYDENEKFEMCQTNELGILQGFHAWLNGLPDTLPSFVGFNIRKFDLPVLAAAYLRNDLYTPAPIGVALVEGYRRSIDYYSIFDTGLQRFAQSLGLEPLAATGAEVWNMYKAGQMTEILNHCRDDVRLVEGIHSKVYG